MYYLVARPTDSARSIDSCFGKTQELIFDVEWEAYDNRRMAAESYAIKYGYDLVHVEDFNPSCEFTTVYDPDETTDQIFFEVRESK